MQVTVFDMDLKDLGKLSERLNTTTDQLNDQLKDIEERLNGLSLGVEAWVTKDPLQQEFTEQSNILGLPTRYRVATELGYFRFAEGWRLAVRTVSYAQTITDANPEWDEATSGSGVEVSRDAKPLLRASRTVRTVAVDRIHDLIEALYDAAMKVVDAVENARKISDSLK